MARFRVKCISAPSEVMLDEIPAEELVVGKIYTVISEGDACRECSEEAAEGEVCDYCDYGRCDPSYRIKPTGRDYSVFFPAFLFEKTPSSIAQFMSHVRGLV